MAQGMFQRQDDRYANLAAVSCTESAANTITFAELDFNIGLGAGVGILIDQVDYFIRGFASLFDASDEELLFALTLRDDIAALNTAHGNNSVIHLGKLGFKMTTSGAFLLQQPLVHQFFPPIITALNRGRMFLAVEGVSQGAAVTVDARIYYRWITLTDREYLELAESFNLMG